MSIPPISSYPHDINMPTHAAKPTVEDEKKVINCTFVTTSSAMRFATANKDSVAAIEGPKAGVWEKLQKVGDWIWNFISGSSSKDETEVSPTDGKPQNNGGIPKLDKPDEMDSDDQWHKLISEMQKMVDREKDIFNFEEEMQKGGPEKLLVYQFNLYMTQKENKETAITVGQKRIMEKHADNANLEKKNFSIKDDLNNDARKVKFLGWVNLGTTIGIGGMLAAAFWTGGVLGGVLLIAQPALSLVKGGVTLAEGWMKYKNDLKKGELLVLGQDIRLNFEAMGDELKTIKLTDEEVAELLKSVRKALENYYQAARIFKGAPH